MKIGLTSDTHYGHCTKKQLVTMFEAMAAEAPDVVVHAGDWTGMHPFPTCVRETMDALRRAMPTVQVLGVRGNHDTWIMERNKMTMEQWHREQFDAMDEGLKQGLLWLESASTPIIEGFAFVGDMAWYAEREPGTNDSYWWPKGASHKGVRKEREEMWGFVCESAEMAAGAGENLIVVTHFPLTGEPHAGPAGWAKALEASYGGPPAAYLQGHLHSRLSTVRDGARQFRCGSDYGSPQYMIIDTDSWG